MQTAAHTWTPIDTSKVKWPMRVMPSLADFAFLLPAMLLFFRMPGTKILFADGDTGWHIRTGEWILQHAAVPKEDLFSFTKPHAAWFAWEWGWDVLFALVHKFWGLSGVGFVTVFLLGLSSLLLYRLVVRACGNEALGFFVTAIAVCGTTGHWLARPHLFSWIFFLIFLHLLRNAEEGNKKALLWLPFLTVLWCNIHGAFFIGIAAVLTTALGVAIETCWREGEADDSAPDWGALARSMLTQAKPYLLCTAACAVATFVNPYGWHLHQHIAAYLTDSMIMDSIQEFQSTSFHGGQAIFFEIMLLAGGSAIFWSFRSRKATAALLVLCWAHLALVAGRNIPFFLMVAAPPVACLLQDVILRSIRASLLGSFFSNLHEICSELRIFERVRRVHVLSALAVLSVAVLFTSGQKGFEGEFNSESFPHQAISVIESSSAKRIFTYDQWGDYLIYRLYPSRKVFMDGRSDFYGDDFLVSTQHIIGGQFDWSQQLSRFAVDMVIVKPDAPLSTILKTAPGWKLLFDDGKVLIFETESRRHERSISAGYSARGQWALGYWQLENLLYERRSS
ncbi:MAG TPA: hypothetical protein VGG97_07660 [Bryobacteraceae bacterium]